MNYYQHHIGDFIRDTSRLSDAQCMAYLRLIWVYYETEEPLECDVDALAFKIGANASDVQQILKHFFFEHDGRWHNSRCDREILAYRNKSKKAKESANARWDNAKAMRTHTDRKANATVFDANQEPITNNQEPITTKEGTPDKPARFDPLSIELPEGLPAEKWAEWVSYRRKRKLTTNELTMRKQAAFLAEQIAEGHSAASIIDASITKGWQGLFEPKDGGGGKPRTSKMNDMGLELTAEEFARSYEDQGFRVARP